MMTIAASQARKPMGVQLKAHVLKTESERRRSVTDVYEYDSVDVPPEFPGGNNAMVKFINSERCYPSGARTDGAHGRGLCGFVVNPDGRISHVTVIRKVHPELDREAVRVIESMPRWTAGVLQGSNVPVFCLLPITFRR